MAVATGSFFEKNRKVVGIAAGVITLLCLAFIVMRMTSSETVVIAVDETAAGVQWNSNLSKREQEIYRQMASINVELADDKQSVKVTGTVISDDDLKKLKSVLEAIEPKVALKSIDVQIVVPK